MVSTVKYPIKEVNINMIPENKVLGIGISESQKTLCKRSLKQYGLVMPIITVEKPDGNLVTLRGEKELSVLKDMNVEKADVFMTSIINPDDIGKAILLLSSLHKELNKISEGMILREILKFKKYNQKQLAQQLMRSEAWISKRLSIAERLNERVAKMVLSKELCPSSAQDISRLPKEKQFEFASKVIFEGIPKSNVEKLVCAYGNKTTSDALKETIINSPNEAMCYINNAEFKKVSKSAIQDKHFENSQRLEASLTLMVKLIGELETNFATTDAVVLGNYASLITVIVSKLDKFLKLVKNIAISSGKSEKTEFQMEVE